MPTCIPCPGPLFADAARVAKVEGTVVLRVVITSGGKAGTLHVRKAAPYGLIAQAIKAVQNWEFKPAQQETVRQSRWQSRSKSLIACFENGPE